MMYSCGVMGQKRQKDMWTKSWMDGGQKKYHIEVGAPPKNKKWMKKKNERNIASAKII